jgi:hypothetical protein
MEDVKIVDSQGIPIKWRFTKVDAVVPSDTVTFSPGNLYIGGSGNVKLKASGDSEWHTFTGLSAGNWIPGEIVAVHTDTTATLILVCY